MINPTLDVDKNKNLTMLYKTEFNVVTFEIFISEKQNKSKWLEDI